MQLDNDRLVGFCRDLVRIPSRSGKERQAVQRAQQEFRALGFDDCLCDEFGSALGVIRNGAGPTVILDAHLDTVGAEPIKEWSNDPFGAWVRDGRVYGRGSADAKGCAAAMVHGCAALLAERERFSGAVIVSLSTLEEVCEGVALGHVIESHGADYVIIGEPTDLKLLRGQRGRAEIALTTYGRPAHSSTPHLGIDAVGRMITLIDLMERMELPCHPFLGKGVQALTDIISTPYPAQSMIPSKCRATFDRRLVVGEDESSIAAQLHDMIAQAATVDPDMAATAEIVSTECSAYTGRAFAFRKFIPAWEMPTDHDIVRKASRALEGIVPAGEITYSLGCTNGSWACVHAGIPTVIFGPGPAESAHAVDEYVPVDQLAAAAGSYRAMVRELLSR